MDTRFSMNSINEDVSCTSKAPRKRVKTACLPCRQHKIKCDGRTPDCSSCIKKGLLCSYQPIKGRQIVTHAHVKKLAEEVEVQKRVSEYWKTLFLNITQPIQTKFETSNISLEVNSGLFNYKETSIDIPNTSYIISRDFLDFLHRLLDQYPAFGIPKETMDMFTAQNVWNIVSQPISEEDMIQFSPDKVIRLWHYANLFQITYMSLPTYKLHTTIWDNVVRFMKHVIWRIKSIPPEWLTYVIANLTTLAQFYYLKHKNGAAESCLLIAKNITQRGKEHMDEFNLINVILSLLAISPNKEQRDLWINEVELSVSKNSRYEAQYIVCYSVGLLNGNSIDFSLEELWKTSSLLARLDNSIDDMTMDEAFNKSMKSHVCLIRAEISARLGHYQSFMEWIESFLDAFLKVKDFAVMKLMYMSLLSLNVRTHRHNETTMSIKDEALKRIVTVVPYLATLDARF